MKSNGKAMSLRFVSLFIILAMVITQFVGLTAFAADTAEVIFTYLPGVDPADLTVKVSNGVLPWSTTLATVNSNNASAPSPAKNTEGNYVVEPGWYTLYSTGEGCYTVQTYFKVTAEDVAAGTITIPVENNQNAGAQNHDPQTLLMLPPVSEMYGDEGTWTIQPKKDGVDNIFALGSDVAPWSGPDHFQTPAFKPERPFYQFTTQDEMEDFIAELAEECDNMYVFSAGTTPGLGNDIPLIVFTKEDLTGLTMEEAGQILQANDKPTYFHGANIHGNEQSSGEGALAVMYDMAATDWGEEVIEDIDVIVYPRINPDGHQLHTRNVSAVEGLQVAVDGNRDHQSFKAEDIYLLHKAWSMFLPEVSMDGHELGWIGYSINAADPDASVYNNGDDMQSTPATDLNIGEELTDLAISMSLQQQQDAIDSGIRMYHYTGNGTTNNNSIGRAYYGHMGSISILVETRGQRGGVFKRRVYTQYMTSRSLIESTRANAQEIVETVANERQNIIDMGKTYDESNRIVLFAPYERNAAGVVSGSNIWQSPLLKKDSRLGAIEQYNLRFDGTYTAQLNVAGGEVLGNYTVQRDRSRPTGYVVPKDMPKVEDLLRIFDGQGIEYIELVPGATLPLEQYYIASETTDPHHTLGLNTIATYDYLTNTFNGFACDLRDKTDVSFPNGAYFVPMDQVAGTIIALTMEPDTNDTATYGGSFVQALINSGNNQIVGGAAANTYLHDPETKNYPIYRFTEDNPREYVADLTSELHLRTAAHLVKAGDYFTLNAKFSTVKSSNAAILTYTFDGDKFEYANFTPADGVTVVNTEYDKGIAKITVISRDYDLQNFGDIMLRAKEDAELVREYQTVELAVEYALKDEAGDKTIATAAADASFTTVGGGDGPLVDGDTNDDGIVDLIDLSNMIDWFGFDSTHPEWATTYVFFDFNNGGDIDVYDISYVAKLI